MKLEVTQIGRSEFRVTSRSQPDCENTVDMEAMGGVGQCSCPDHKFRCEPNWMDCQIYDLDPFQWTGSFRTFCSHKKAVWRAFNYTKEIAIEGAKKYGAIGV